MIDCGNRSDNDSDWIILSLVGEPVCGNEEHGRRKRETKCKIRSRKLREREKCVREIEGVMVGWVC
jgi:hypothetical protein